MFFLFVLQYLAAIANMANEIKFSTGNWVHLYFKRNFNSNTNKTLNSKIHWNDLNNFFIFAFGITFVRSFNQSERTNEQTTKMCEMREKYFGMKEKQGERRRMGKREIAKVKLDIFPCALMRWWQNEMDTGKRKPCERTKEVPVVRKRKKTKQSEEKWHQEKKDKNREKFETSRWQNTFPFDHKWTNRVANKNNEQKTTMENTQRKKQQTNGKVNTEDKFRDMNNHLRERKSVHKMVQPTQHRPRFSFFSPPPNIANRDSNC